MSAALIALIAQLAPLATNLILTLIHPDGTQTIIATLNNVDATNAANAAELQKFQALLGTAIPKKA